MTYEISQSQMEKNLARTDEEMDASWDEVGIVYIDGDFSQIDSSKFIPEVYVNSENENDPTCEYDYSKRTKKGRYMARCEICKKPVGARTTKKINPYLTEYRYECKDCNYKFKLIGNPEAIFPEIEHDEDTIRTYFTLSHSRFWWSTIVATYLLRHKEQVKNINKLKKELKDEESKLNKIRSDYVILHGIAHDESTHKMTEDDLYRMKNAWVVGLM